MAVGQQDRAFDGFRPMTRREVVRAGLFAGGLAPVLFSAPAHAVGMVAPKSSGEMKLSFHQQHTGESFSGVYRVGNRYLPEAFDEINKVLRDYRTGEDFPIDPRAIDLLYAMQHKIGSGKPFQILSGYRSPKTNMMLSKSGGGVARNSLHMTGQAIDIRMPGYSTRKLSDLAASLRVGGVGYYGKRDFVHIDTGQVRRWS